MSIRLQVLVDPAEMRDIKQFAKASHQTVSEWVRHALRQARRQYPEHEASRKLHVIREAARHSYPAGSMEEMLRDIEKGYTGGEGP